ncbi:hypothetical protein [uncultured Flavobacterium sp.]|uniref:hypothetical protein n=1 Tax=uncultured Flavobacterium sp. TaxID=165435 RepID=UPI0030EC812C
MESNSQLRALIDKIHQLKDKIETEEEREAYRIVVAILRKKLSMDRITHRDKQSYFGILLDDDNRKPLCKLHLTINKKHLGLIHESKNKNKQSIETFNEFYLFEEGFLKTIGFYEKE